MSGRIHCASTVVQPGRPGRSTENTLSDSIQPMRDVKWQPNLQVGINKNIKDNKKRSRRGEGDIDPAQILPAPKTVMPRYSRTGQSRAGGTTRPPPEAPEASPSPTRAYFLTTKSSDVTPETTKTAMFTPRATIRGKGGGVARKNSRYAGVIPQGPSSKKATAPLTVEELHKGMLTEEAIRMAAGGELQEVTRLSLVIDSSQVSVDGVWDTLPKLHTLTLDGSRLLSFRDLGVGLRDLNTLCLQGSYVKGLDGIGALSGLRELRLAHNRISDVTPLACHGSLQVLDLEKNRLNDMNALEILSSLPLLYSLNLSQNPLMTSLGKLRDGGGRKVVRHIISQIRILNGTHLSSWDGGPVDDETLAEADFLVYQDASRERAALTEEEEIVAAESAATDYVEGNGLPAGGREAGGGRGGDASEAYLEGLNGDYIPGRMTRPSVVLAAAEGAFCGHGSRSLPQPALGGAMHWDSDLTQGGRQALSGNPSSAIRRHQWGRGAGKGRNGHSPTRILETLDLAKVMEQGLKQRYNTQQSAERVSEWRRETRSDSVPEEDSCLEPLDSATLRSRQGALPHSSSALERGFDHPGGLRAGGSSGVSSVATTTTTNTATTWASLSTSAASVSGLSAAVVDDDGGDMRNMVLAGAGARRISCGRPWTTGGFREGCRLSSRDTHSDRHTRRTPSQRNGSAAVVDEEGHQGAGQQEWGGSGPPRLRPQTARVHGRLRGSSDPEEGSNASWQHVWESLQAARLIASPRAVNATPAKARKETEAAAEEEGEEEGVGRSAPTGRGDGAERTIGGVDFRRQRRARKLAMAARGGAVGYLHGYDSASSAPEEKAAGGSRGEDSEETGDRAQIKNLALALISATPGAGGNVCSASSTQASEMAAAAAEGLSTGSHGGQERTHDVALRTTSTLSGAHGLLLPPKGRRRETASLLSRRSLAVMDEDSCSSSEDESVRLVDASDPAAPGGDGSQPLGKGQTRSCVDDLDDDGAVARGGERSGGDCAGWTSSSRRESSIHASRMLGFDLRKSLAAIDEWTDKAATTAKSCTPCQGVAKAWARQKQVPFLAGHTAGGSGFSLLSPKSSSPGASTKVAGREAEDHGSIGGLADGVSSRGKGILPIPQDDEAERSSRIYNVAEDDEDDDEDNDDGESVLSVAAARAALGLSKGVAPVAPASSSTSARGTPSLAEIDAITAERNNFNGCMTGAPSTAKKDRRKQRKRSSSSCSKGIFDKMEGREGGRNRRTESASARKTAAMVTAALPGVAVGMSDEELKGMLKQQPRTVPELRTKESFREFFQGMEAERMSRLLRGAYEGNLPPDQVDKKVEKRLGLVGDILAW